MIDYSTGLLQAMSNMTTAELKSYSTNEYSHNLGSYKGSVNSSWFGRAASMAWNYNTTKLIAENVLGEDSDFYGIEEYGYNAINDPNLQENNWIQSYYPKAWEGLLRSKSSISTERTIDKIVNIHPFNMKMQQGSILGNLMAAIPAALFDPVNFIPVGGIALKSFGVSRATANTLKVKMATNSLENLALTLAVEPLMRGHDLTRTEEDAFADAVGSLLLGGILPGAGHLAGKGIRKASRQAQRQLLGGKTSDEFIEEHNQQIRDELERITNEDPQAQAVMDRIDETEGLISSQQDIETSVGYLKEALEAVQGGASVILGASPDSFVGKYLTKFLFFNPTQRLLFNKSEGVQIIGKTLLRTNLIGNQLGRSRVAFEELKEFVEQQWEAKQQDLRGVVDEYQAKEVQVSLDKKLTDDELYDLAGKLVLSGRDTIDEVVNWYLPSRTFGDPDTDPFRIIRNDTTTKSAIEKLAKEQRKIQDSIYKTAEMTGFFTKEADDANGSQLSNQRSYLSRFMDTNAIDQAQMDTGNAFVSSLVRGMTERRSQNLAMFMQIESKWAQRIKSGEAAKLRAESAGRSTEGIDAQIANAKEYQSAAQEKVEQFESDDWEYQSEEIAKNIAQNYSGSMDLQSQGHTSSGGAAQLMQRKVLIDDKYLAPWKHNNILMVNERTGKHLIPKLVAAAEMQSRQDHFGLSKRISQATEKLAKLKERLAHGDIDSLDDTAKKARKNEWLNTVDDIIDISEELEISNRAYLLGGEDGDFNVRNPSDLDNPNSKFESVEDVRQFLRDTVEQRADLRDEVLHAMETLDEANRQIPYIQQNYIRLFNKRQRIQHELLTGDELVSDNQYYEVLRGKKYGPTDKDGVRLPLTEFNKTDTKKIEYDVRVTKKGATYVYITQGPIVGRAKLGVTKKARGAQGATVDILGESGAKGFYIQINNKFLWIDPLEFKTKEKAALDTKSTQRGLPAHVASSMGKKSKKVDAEIEKLEEGTGFTERLEQEAVDRRATLERDLDTTNKLIELELKTRNTRSDVIKLDRKMWKAWETLNAKLGQFDDLTKKLNQVASDIDISTRSEVFKGVGKKHIKHMPEGGQASNYIGFSDNIRTFEAFKWWINGIRRRATGPDAEERLLGINDHISEYEYAVFRAERARRDSAYLLTDSRHLISFSNRSIRAEGGNHRDMKKSGEDIDFIWNQLLNRNQGDTGGSLDQTIRVLKNMNYMRYMGMVTIASLSDFGNAVGTLGLSRYVRTLWHYIGRPDRKNLSEFANLNAAFEVASLQGRSATVGGLDQGGDFYNPDTGKSIPQAGSGGAYGKTLDWMDRNLGQGSEGMRVYNRMNMLNKWNAFNKRVMTLGVEDMIAEIGIKLGKGQSVSERDLGITRSFGFSESDLIKAGAYFELYGDRKSTIVGRDFLLANSEKWTDASFAFKYRAKIKGAVNNIIVTPSIGSNPKWTSHKGLSLLWQFKSFLAASFDMTFLPWLQRGVLYKDPNQIMQLVTTATLGSMTYGIYEVLKGNNPFHDKPIKDDDGNVVDTVHWSRTMIAQGLDRGGMFAGMFELQNTFERPTGIGFHSLVSGSMDTQYRARHPLDLFGGPTVGAVDDLIKAAAWIGKIPERPTSGPIGALRRLGPAQNTIWAKVILDVGPSLFDTVTGKGSYFAPAPGAPRDYFNLLPDRDHAFKTIQKRLAGE